MGYSLYFLVDVFICQFFNLQSASATFHCITVYNNHHHPHIDSTTEQLDNVICNIINHDYVLVVSVFCVYMTQEFRSEEVCSTYAPSQRRGAYTLQTSDDRGLRVVHMQNTPSNHDSYNIYANRH